MKLLNKQVEKRLIVKLDKSFASDNAKGIMRYGTENDYPQIIERLIFSSQTAKACANIHAKFIGGDGFENEAIGAVVVGKDNRGKDITLDSIRRKAAQSLAFFNGYYLHVNVNLNGDVDNVTLVPFKNCRFAKEDDKGYCGKIGMHSNWSKEPEGAKLEKAKINWTDIFNLNENVLLAQFEAAGSVDKFKGQTFFQFFDDNYLYPLSPFDSVYLDMDTEYQVQLFKNREIRNGFSDKIIMRTVAGEDENENIAFEKEVQSFMGAEGAKAIVLADEPDENGNIKANGAFAVEKIATNINDKLFEGWEKSIPNNIRKAINALPAVLIDYEMGQLGQASGEMIIQATNYYNALTSEKRNAFAEGLQEVFKHHPNPILRNNTNWNLKPVELYKIESKDEANTQKLAAQATLKGSVGGVTALITLQQSVGAGTSSRESAIAIIQEIYGIAPNVAETLIGNPVKTPINYVAPKP